jgi:hypothetical protein
MKMKGSSEMEASQWIFSGFLAPGVICRQRINHMQESPKDLYPRDQMQCFFKIGQSKKDDQRTKREIPDAIHRQQINSMRARPVLLQEFESALSSQNGEDGHE